MNLESGRIELLSRLYPLPRFLLQCLQARRVVEPETFVRFSTNDFLHLLDSHRLSTVFYQLLRTNEPAVAELREQLAERYVANKMGMLARTAELCQIIRLFEQNSIHTIALKGPLLGKLYYNDYTLRECKDLDILVDPADVETAYQLLINAGYELTTVLWNSPKQKALYNDTFYHYNLYHPAKAVQIELHWRLNITTDSPDSKVKPVGDQLIAQTIGGQLIYSLSAIDNFVYLCVHGSMHDWKRLFWLYDIVQIIEKEGPAFLTDAYQRAVELKADRYVLAGCYMAAGLFGLRLPSSIRHALDKDQTLPGLSANFISAINYITEPYQSPVSSVRAVGQGLNKLMSFYQSTYYFGGHRAALSAFRRFFINPDYWHIYSFSDRLFALNYMAAPFLWVYSAFTKFDR